MLTSRVRAPLPTNPETEDIFSSALGALFTDDTQNSHGTPGQSVTYCSPRFGEIRLHIPAHPDVEEGRKLFAHYLWNAGVIAAEAIEVASHDEDENDNNEVNNDTDMVEWDKRYWDMRGQHVLELGAGTALPSLLSALSGASTVTVTDYPSSPALTTGAIDQNVKENILSRAPNYLTQISIYGYTWGTNTFYSPSTYGKPIPSTSLIKPDGTFSKILICDCLWMPSQHLNLVKTILQFLSTTPPSSPRDTTPCALVIAGFHTGRGIVRDFFEIATGKMTSSQTEQMQPWGAEDEARTDDDTLVEEEKEYVGKLKAEQIFEVDVNGKRRDYVPIREGEYKEASKRWVVCAVLVRR